MKKIYLIDVSSMFFRAFYAIRPLTSPQGVPVNAIYGFLSMITKLIKAEKPELMVFCYDRKEPSFRKEMYEEYKANRSEMPEDLAVQIPYIKRMADLLGIPSLEVPTFEADDLIGTLTRQAREKKIEVEIVSGDKDFAQLIAPGVVMYDTMKEFRYDSAAVKEKWGITPAQMIDYLAIVGDSSDNIPGVAGLGPKGACKLLEQFGTLEAIYERIDEVSSKSVKEKLLAAKDKAFLSKKLITIVQHIDLPGTFDDYKLKPHKRDELRAFLQELNFKNFEKTLLGDEGAPAAETPVTESETKEAATVVHTKELPGETVEASTFFSSLSEGTELWGFADERGVFVCDGKKVYTLEGETASCGLLADEKKVRWSSFDLKTFWHRIGCQNPIGAWDSMLAAYVVQAGDCSDPAKVLERNLGASLPEFASPSQWLATHADLRKVLIDKMKEMNLTTIYKELDLPLAAILLRMEKKGIRLDLPQLKKQSEELTGEIAALEKRVHELAGESFSVGSPKQLGVVLFEKLGLTATKKTKTGFSTDSDVLEKLDHPIAKQVLQWRELSKLKSTYVDALPELADTDDRIHTHFNQALTTTGRLSSTTPNLQNIPVRTDRGQRVRKAFIAGPGLKLLSVDYSQIELRILAHISGDPGMTKAFKEDLDIHAATAAEVFNVDLKSVTSEQRRIAKAVNFGIAYGQGAFGLAEVLGIPRGEAQGIIKRYFERFKGVEDYIHSTTTMAHEKGYVETLVGRRRTIEELRSKNPALKKFGERAAINAPIQGTASDLVKKAMILVNEQIPLPMLLQVHDELIFEGPEDELRHWSPKILQVLESVATLSVPLKANLAIGENWDEAH